MVNRAVYASSESKEWYTPLELLCSIRDFFDGEITCDPCADPMRRVGALRSYCREDDGLLRSWVAENGLFMNPPYGREIGKWVRKFVREPRRGIALVPARPGTRWYRDAALRLPMLSLAGRQSFTRPDGTTGPAPFDSVLMFAADVSEWTHFFEHFAYLDAIPYVPMASLTTWFTTYGGFEYATAYNRSA